MTRIRRIIRCHDTIDWRARMLALRIRITCMWVTLMFIIYTGTQSNTRNHAPYRQRGRIGVHTRDIIIVNVRVCMSSRYKSDIDL